MPEGNNISFFYTKQHYTMDGKPALWKIAYYPLNECGKTGEVYDEPRALVEKPIEGGIDFREIPLRYLTPVGGGDEAEELELV